MFYYMKNYLKLFFKYTSDFVNKLINQTNNRSWINIFTDHMQEII